MRRDFHKLKRSLIGIKTKRAVDALNSPKTLFLDSFFIFIFDVYLLVMERQKQHNTLKKYSFKYIKI